MIPIIITIATTIWYFPIFKQYKNGFFYFFLVMALTEPIGLIAKKTMGVEFIIYVYFVSMIFRMFFSFYYANSLNKKSILFMAIILLPLFFLPAKAVFFYNSIFGSIILYNFSKIFYSESIKFNSFNLYYILLIIYQLSSIIKYQEPVYTIVYFYTTLIILQTLIGFYFVFFNIKNSPKFDFKRSVKSV